MAVRILHYSDLETAFDTPDRISRLAGLIQSRTTPNTIIIDTGDTLAPSLLSLETAGHHPLDYYSRVDPDLATFGNHDFDIGFDALRDIIAGSPQTWLGTNVFFNDQRFGERVGVQATTCIQIADTTLGFFSLLTPETPAITPEAEPLQVTDPFSAAQDAVTALRDQGADEIIALSHLGQPDEQLAATVDIDVILGGHVHTRRIERIADTLCARPGVNGDTLLELTYDDDWTIEPLQVASGPSDEELRRTLEDRLDQTGLTEPVTEISRPIDRSREAIFAGQTPLGRIVAEAYRWATNADVGLQNSGGLRDGPPLEGQVTAADLVGIIPFDEPVAVADVSGQQLSAILEATNGRHATVGNPNWQLGHTSGATLEWTNDRLTDVRIAGQPIKSDSSYRLATSDYLLWSEREFPTLGPADLVDRTDKRQYEILVEYARTHGLQQGQRVDS